MRILAIDIGSSAIKAAIILNNRFSGPIIRSPFPTSFVESLAQVDARHIPRSRGRALRDMGNVVRHVDCIGLSVMSPAWVAMDRRGNPLTPLVTHQDRRSVTVAMNLETRIGKARHIRLAGNRPFPGGISSTTYAWFNHNAASLMKKADLVGHLNTFLHRQLTHSRVIDPSNACFMGLHNWRTLDTWNDELIEAVGASQHCLPQIVSADAIAGMITHQAASKFGLIHGTPMVTGCMDASSAMLATGAGVGQVLHVSGSTDALLICTDKPRTHERLITCPVGVGNRWMSISTIAAAGSALTWAHRTLYADLSVSAFHKLVGRLSRQATPSSVRFDPYLAGDRMTIEQRHAAFHGLTLGTSRDAMLYAIIQSLLAASSDRIQLMKSHVSVPMLPTVITTGGVLGGLDKAFHGDWPRGWRYRNVNEATLLGLAKLVL